MGKIINPTKYLLRADLLPGPSLGDGDRVGNEVDNFSPLKDLMFYWGETGNEQ